jgi:hypothetical protein
VIDVERLPPDFVELRVNQPPASFSGIPDFADDVIFKKARIEIRPENRSEPVRPSPTLTRKFLRGAGVCWGN